MSAERPTRDDYVAWRTATTRWARRRRLRPPEQRDATTSSSTPRQRPPLRGDRRRRPRAARRSAWWRRRRAATSREIGFPEPIEMGMVVDKVGRSSVIYRIGLFQGDLRRGRGRGPVRARLRRQRPRRRRPAGGADPGRDPGRRGAAAASLTPRGTDAVLVPRAARGTIESPPTSDSGGDPRADDRPRDALHPAARRSGRGLRRLPAPRRGGPGSSRGSARRMGKAVDALPTLDEETPTPGADARHRRGSILRAECVSARRDAPNASHRL